MLAGDALADFLNRKSSAPLDELSHCALKLLSILSPPHVAWIRGERRANARAAVSAALNWDAVADWRVKTETACGTKLALSLPSSVINPSLPAHLSRNFSTIAYGAEKNSR
jgi:hypothetical protein